MVSCEQEDTTINAAPAEKPRARILVADDQRHIVKLLQTHLERAGYEVFTAYDYPEALEVVRAQKLDMVILDTIMPGVTSTRHDASYYRTIQQPPPEPQGCLARLLHISPRQGAPTVILHLAQLDPVEDLRSLPDARDGRLLFLVGNSSTAFIRCDTTGEGIGYLMRPFRPDELLAAVERLLAPTPNS